MSAARLARTAFQSATRRAQNAASSTARVSRRTMSASTSHGAAKSSDTPWIVGSALVFGPLFLYLVSPSTRKNDHAVHNDKHDFPAFHPHEENAAAKPAEEKPAPEVIMKDDEGKEENVGSSLQLSEASDAPKAAQTPEDQAKLRVEAEGNAEPAGEEAGEKPAPSEAKSDVQESEGAKGEKSGTFQKEGEEGPTNMGTAKKAASEGIEPKQAAEQEGKEH